MMLTVARRLLSHTISHTYIFTDPIIPYPTLPHPNPNPNPALRLHLT
jgi:hypothetical protein